MGRVVNGTPLSPADYDRWYHAGAGRWIGHREVQLLRRALAPTPDDRLLDVGCGTGYFTRRLARTPVALAVGLDSDADRIRYARERAGERERYVVGPAERLPFPDRSFDLSVAVTSLCFAADERAAAREIMRVTRCRFAIGLLNRRSLLWWAKGRAGGAGGYRGARWHTTRQARALFEDLPVAQLTVRTAIQVPYDGWPPRGLERVIPTAPPWGGFLLVTGNVSGGP